MLAEGQVYEAKFDSLDKVSGKITGRQGVAQPKSSEKVSDSQEETTRENCKVVASAFEHPNYETHDCKLLRGALLPRREVEEFEIYHVERRYFQGENAMRMVERLLNIDAGLHSVYRFGYKNNHATFDKEPASTLGKRPREGWSGREGKNSAYEPSGHGRPKFDYHGSSR